MTTLQIPTQPIPAQIIQVVLNGQQCQISLYLKTTGLYMDLTSNGVVITVGVLMLNGVPLTVNYSGFLGNLAVIDTQGTSDPTYDGLGSRYQLVYYV